MSSEMQFLCFTTSMPHLNIKLNAGSTTMSKFYNQLHSKLANSHFLQYFEDFT